MRLTPIPTSLLLEDGLAMWGIACRSMARPDRKRYGGAQFPPSTLLALCHAGVVLPHG